jgi:hypothetical protein
VAQGEGPEFKSQYHTTNTKTYTFFSKSVFANFNILLVAIAILGIAYPLGQKVNQLPRLIFLAL